MSNTQIIAAALDAAETAARSSSMDLIVSRDSDGLWLSRRLKGRTQQVGRVQIDDLGDSIEVVETANRIRSTVVDIADAARAVIEASR